MKNLLLLIFLLTTCFASSQIVNIPDPNFKSKLIALGVDTNADGEIQLSEAQAVTSLNLNNSNISNAEGIQAFTNLVDLYIKGNSITTLDISAITPLETLDCRNNTLVTLDLSSNLNLTSLTVSSNNLTSLNVSNNTNLTYLDGGYNPLTTLDLSNNPLLEYFSIYSSFITTLDFTFNTHLTALYIAGNELLETVLIKNGSDESANMDEGSWAENWFFSNHPSLRYVCADEFQMVDIQQYAGTDYPVNSFCSIPPGGDINTITGVTRLDSDGDGCDAGDSSMSYFSFNINFDGVSTNSIAYSNSQGIYNVYAGQVGTYTLLPNLENPNYFTISPSPADVIVPIIDGSTITQNFCVEADGVVPDLEVIISPAIPARPGFEATYRLTYKNKGNQTLSGDVQFNYDDTVMDFVSSTTTPDIQNYGMLTYNFTDLLPYQTKSILIAFNVNSPTDTPPVNIDDVLEFSAVINPVVGDETPLDNSFIYNQIVVGSYDPNNILCIQGEEVPTTYIGEYLHYVINFENTGTAPAENIVVTMEINPDDFDRNSLQILNASHDMQTVINGNIAEFYFQNIALDTGGHGNILFKIKTNSDLILTDEVGAQANIYFDYNFPVETNEALTTFRVLGVDKFDASQIAVYPNPANDIVKIQSSSVIKDITIFDLQGRRIQTLKEETNTTEVNISELKTGIYFFSIETENGIGIKKVMKP